MPSGMPCSVCGMVRHSNARVAVESWLAASYCDVRGYDSNKTTLISKLHLTKYFFVGVNEVCNTNSYTFHGKKNPKTTMIR